MPNPGLHLAALDPDARVSVTAGATGQPVQLTSAEVEGTLTDAHYEALRHLPSAVAGSNPTPRRIPNLLAWFDASRITGLADAAAVTSWADFSGKGRNATQGTSTKQPTYRTSVINGRPAVRFDGTDDALLTSTSITAPYTIFVVARHNAVHAAQTRIAGSLFRTAESTIAGYVSSTISRNVGTTNGVWMVITGEFNGASSYLMAAAGRSGPSDTGSGTITLVMGSNPTVSGEYFNGDLAEVVAYSGVLSSGDRQHVERYLGRKYNLSVL